MLDGIKAKRFNAAVTAVINVAWFCQDLVKKYSAQGSANGLVVAAASKILAPLSTLEQRWHDMDLLSLALQNSKCDEDLDAWLKLSLDMLDCMQIDSAQLGDLSYRKVECFILAKTIRLFWRIGKVNRSRYFERRFAIAYGFVLDSGNGFEGFAGGDQEAIISYLAANNYKVS